MITGYGKPPPQVTGAREASASFADADPTPHTPMWLSHPTVPTSGAL